MKIKLMKTIALVATVAASLFSGSSTVVADEAFEQQDATLTQAPVIEDGRTFRLVRVAYEDLNLERPAGVQALYKRIEIAAKTVCHPRPDGRDLLMQKDWQQCYDTALDNAVASTQFPALKRYHALRAGRAAGAEEEEQVAKAH